MVPTTTSEPVTRTPAITAPPGRVGVLIVLLGALTAIAPLATDMYVPGFPEMGRTLHASDSAVQLSMTSFLAGLVIGQLLIGPLSDGLGRRRLLVSGTALFAVLSLVCAFAPTIETLVAARFLEGVAGAAGMVLARAVLTDRFHGPELPRYFSLLTMVLSVAPVAAPVIGGGLLSVGGWRATFVVLAIFGALLFLAVLPGVPESLPPERRHTGGVASTFHAMGRLLGHRAFLGSTLTLAFAAAALFACIAGSSFVFQEVYDTSAGLYSLIFAVNACGMLLAGAVFGVLSRRLTMGTLLSASVAVALVAVLVQVLLLATVGGSLAGTWVTLFFAAFGIGGVFPASMSLGQSLGREASGAASALLGGIQFLFGALASPLVGMFGTASAMPMAAIMLGSLICAALCLVFLVRPWRR
ncbi:multidrug effflux MFS transporter [Streptomyces caniscabiei]|uniref:Multidrug effflux MFS transporter n=1 Tax=Streptomyces caniscabiei TaxID=2746961 RepID=A0A927KZV1_9ACTN|nr:multidrug effflux MFS transporter [Streptomyces caniscabiei]MBD9722448.1 multidrug effflux MFS transporter [Streptomyces caniscabiei]MDX3514374.1 multidrug effflux MFS transporter [Streptomyces caniscabiei]MDX3716600.1 multidrug effflux MFS transporter [Streptomyces caniscabiei]WEO22488.1 multidrug effflux MFS transporter [Streptomyces caniscabiei]